MAGCTRTASLVRLLLASVLSPSAAAPRSCAILKKANPCLLECPGSPILRFDLASFQKAAPYISTQDSDSHTYFVDACTPLTQVTCGATTGTPVAAIQAWGGTPPHIDSSQCAVLGLYRTRNCTVADPLPGSAASAPSLLCQYIGGEDQRSVGVRYECSPGLRTPTYSAEQFGSNHYEIRLRGEAACGVVYTLPLSWGSISLILFFVAVVLYIGGGLVYNVKVAKMPLGMRALPQIEYWRELPGLVKDGCWFSWVQAQKAYYGVRHGAAPPLDPSLSRRLAENEGGGPDRT